MTVTDERGAPVSPVCFAWDDGQRAPVSSCDAPGAGTLVAAGMGRPGVVRIDAVAPTTGTLTQTRTAPGLDLAGPWRLTLGPDGAQVDVVNVPESGVPSASATASGAASTVPSGSATASDAGSAAPSAAGSAPPASRPGSDVPSARGETVSPSPSSAPVLGLPGTGAGGDGGPTLLTVLLAAMAAALLLVAGMAIVRRAG